MINVIKADGSREPFSETKVLSSMQRAGVPQDISRKLLTKSKARLYDNIQTWEIYQGIQKELSSDKKPYYRTRYGLKQAIMMLGPTGYPFEDFVAAILEAEGYKTAVRQIIRGQCVLHEIDVIAEKDNRKIMVEAKFHNNSGARSDLHVAMYTKARFDDVKAGNKLSHCMLITNTKASSDALTYAACSNFQVVSWNYPEGQSLRETIERHHLHPVTLLTSIPHAAKLNLLENHIILCRDIADNPGALNTTRLTSREKKAVRDEIFFLTEVRAQTASTQQITRP